MAKNKKKGLPKQFKNSNPLEDRILNKVMLLKNQEKPMVKRLLSSDPNVLNNDVGFSMPASEAAGAESISTHLMSTGSTQNPAYNLVFPTLTQNEEGDIGFPEDLWEPVKQNNFIKAPANKSHEFSSTGYKQAAKDIENEFGYLYDTPKKEKQVEKFRTGGTVKAQNGFPYPPPGMMPLAGSMYPMMTANDQSDARKAYAYQQANPFVVQRSTPGNPNDAQFQKFANQQIVGEQLDDQLTVAESYNNALNNTTEPLGIKFTPGQSNPFTTATQPASGAEPDFMNFPMNYDHFKVLPDGNPQPNGAADAAAKSYQNALANAEVTTPTGTPESDTNTLTDPETGETITQEEARRKGIDSAAYFGLIKGMDFASLIKNATQAPPPNVQLAQTHLQRIDLDNTAFDTERAKIGEMQNKSFRRFREGAGQVGDLMRGVAAISGQGQEALREVSVAERQQQNQESMMNVDIQNKEQMIQDQQHDKELMTNYQIQQQAAARKDQMVTDSLTNIKKDFQVEAQYNEQKDAMNRQEEYDRDYINKQQDVQLLTLAHQQSIGYDETQEYKQGLQTKRSEFLQTTAEEMKKDYGDRFSFDIMDSERASVNEANTNYAELQRRHKAGVPIDPGEDADQIKQDEFLEDKIQYKKDSDYLDALGKQYEKDQTELTRKESYITEFDRRFRESKIESSYRDEYTTAKGLLTPQQIQRRIETLLTTER